MKTYHNSKYHLIHNDDFEPEDREEINLFIASMYFIAVLLIGCLILFIHQNF